MKENKEKTEEPFYKYHYGKWIKAGVIKLQKVIDKEKPSH